MGLKIHLRTQEDFMKKIAIIGSPGSGKTTLAAGLFYHLKMMAEHVEMVPELIKYKVYKNINFELEGFDILNTLEQKEFEEIFESENAKNQIDFIICEAPLCNGYFYSSFYQKQLEFPILKKIAESKINTYDLMIFVERSPEAEYVSFGRKESFEQARKLEIHITEHLKELGYNKPIIRVNQATPIKDILNMISVHVGYKKQGEE